MHEFDRQQRHNRHFMTELFKHTEEKLREHNMSLSESPAYSPTN